MPPKRKKAIEPVDGVRRNSELEMPLGVGDKKMAVPGSIPPKKERKKNPTQEQLYFDEMEVKKAEEAQKGQDPTVESDKAKEWTKKNLLQDNDEEDDPEETFVVSKKDLAKMLQNPLGVLCVSNEKDADFVHAYMKLGNVQDALVACEYAPRKILKNRTALLTIAREMMNRTEIKAAIGWCKSQRMDDLIVSRDEHADILSQVVRGNIGDMLDDEGKLVPSLVKQHGRCIESYASKVDKKGKIHISLKMRNPLAAAQELGKYEEWEKQGKSNVSSGGNLADDAIEAIENEDILEVEVVEDGQEEPASSEV